MPPNGSCITAKSRTIIVGLRCFVRHIAVSMLFPRDVTSSRFNRVCLTQMRCVGLACVNHVLLASIGQRLLCAIPWPFFVRIDPLRLRSMRCRICSIQNSHCELIGTPRCDVPILPTVFRRHLCLRLQSVLIKCEFALHAQSAYVALIESRCRPIANKHFQGGVSFALNHSAGPIHVRRASSEECRHHPSSLGRARRTLRTSPKFVGPGLMNNAGTAQVHWTGPGEACGLHPSLSDRAQRSLRPSPKFVGLSLFGL